MWMDYVKMLERCGNDIQSPRYICPANLPEEHDRYMRKVHIIEDKKKRAEDIIKARERSEFQGTERKILRYPYQ